MNHFRADEGGRSRMTECYRGPWRGRVAIVGGCGHVGLPLGMVLARAGLPVDLVDTSAERLARSMAETGLGGIDLAYCPERILQGKSLAELERLPQIVGGATPAAAARAAALFGVFCPKVLFLAPTEAELAKLFCNAYRYINFAIANEFFLLAERHGADFHRIYHAARDDYPRLRGLARPGFAAGPCLVKDTC